MIEWVVRRVLSVSEIDSICVATDAAEIVQACQGLPVDVCMTDPSHPSGTDRLAEVVKLKGYASDDLVINVQGDEPLIHLAHIQTLLTCMAQPCIYSMATISEPIQTVESLMNPNCVKVVTNHASEALYFSRAPIPWDRSGAYDFDFRSDSNSNIDSVVCKKHVGIYAYRVSFLNRYTALPQGVLERLECLEQLRVLESGEKIYVAHSNHISEAGVDTEEDLLRVSKRLMAS